MSNLLTIAKAVRTAITTLAATVKTENSYPDSPTIRLRKRMANYGRRADQLMAFGSGITVVPLGPKPAGGTNEREDIGYQYLIALAQGTISDNLDVTDWPFAVWEEAIHQRFQNRRIGGMTLDNACELHTSIRQGELPEWAQLEEGVDATFLTLTVFVRERRR